MDLLRPDVLTHGISGIRRLAAMAETYYVAVAPWHEGGPIANAAALHAAASIPNFSCASTPLATTGAPPHDGYFPLSNPSRTRRRESTRKVRKGAIA